MKTLSTPTLAAVAPATSCSRGRAFAWGIVSSGKLLIRSLRPTRKEAQDDMADLVRVPWKFLRQKCDYRAVKVRMSFRENADVHGPRP